MKSFIEVLKRPLSKKHKQKGLTLAEILLSLVIIVIVFVLLAQNFGWGTDKAKLTGVTQGFKPYQNAFEGLLNEHSGFAFADAQTMDYEAVNRYLAPDYQITTVTNGVAGSNPINRVKAEDPWNTQYEVQAKWISESKMLLAVATRGKDKKSSTATDLFTVTKSGNDKDDVVLVTEYEDGYVNSCTYGLENDIGNIDRDDTTGIITGCK